MKGIWETSVVDSTTLSMVNQMSYNDVVKFTDKETGRLLAITFDHECKWVLMEFMEGSDVIIEAYELEIKE